MPAAIAVPLIVGAVSAGATAYGAHAAGKSASRAAQLQAQGDAQTIDLERQRDAEAKRQWDLDQAFKQQQFAASEEQRLHDRQLQDEREARLAPYRAASAQAMGRLGDFLGLGRGGGQPMPTGGGGTIAPVVTGNTLTFQRRPATLGAATGLQ